MFGVILFRLWYLEVLRATSIWSKRRQPRPRGDGAGAARRDLDRDGEVLVGNRTALALQIRKDELPEDTGERGKVLKSVSQVTGMSVEQIRKEIEKQTKLLPRSRDSQRDVARPRLLRARERGEFQGASVDRVHVRHIRRSTARIFGYVRRSAPSNSKSRST